MIIKGLTESTVRIATVRTTGERFIVQRLSIDTRPEQSKCYTWGHVTSFRGVEAKHGPSRVFLREAVDVVEAPRTAKLLGELLDQYVRHLRADGVIVHRTNRGNYRILGRTQ